MEEKKRNGRERERGIKRGETYILVQESFSLEDEVRVLSRKQAPVKVKRRRRPLLVGMEGCSGGSTPLAGVMDGS